MDTLTLETALLFDTYTRGQFGAVCAADELPKNVDKLPSIYIVNTDPASNPGLHWTCIYIGREVSNFYDPLAQPPQKEFLDFLTRNSESGYLLNTRQLQAFGSETCGHHCLYFAFFRSRGIPMEYIVQSYTPDYALNDWMVQQFVVDVYNI